MAREIDDHHIFRLRGFESLQLYLRARRHRIWRLARKTFERRDQVRPGRAMVVQPGDFDTSESSYLFLLSPQFVTDKLGVRDRIIQVEIGIGVFVNPNGEY